MFSYKITGISINDLITVFFRTVILLTLFFLLTSMTALAQGKIITIDGKPALLKPNGKWEYLKTRKKKQSSQAKDCHLSKDYTDNIKGTILKITEREKLVKYTPYEFQKLFPNQDYLMLDAYISNVNNKLALFLKINIQTNNPHNAYGSIYKDSQLILKLKNGETVTLHNGQSESPKVDYLNDKTTYFTFYEVNEAAAELLKSVEVEMLRLFWSKGYEDYPVVNPDFFVRQLNCVK